MVEAKMKSRRGNGTPHPKGRRRSEEEEEEKENTMQSSVKSSLDNLLRVHTQVTQTLHQIDKMVLNIQELASSNHLLPDEVDDFSDALASIDSNLQDWNEYLKGAAERSSVAHELSSRESTPVKRTVSEFGTISCSPLVGSSDLADSASVMMMSPFPQTPIMQSPPRSIQALYTISEGSSLPTPCSDQKPQEALFTTPEGPTCQSHLVFDTPPAHITGQFRIPETPGFGTSPPRTCRLLRPEEVVSVDCDGAPSTPVMASPFRTPGILLECESSESSSTGSPAIMDDLTASTVKRLGPRGLQERLWQELTTHKADILQPSVKHNR